MRWPPLLQAAGLCALLSCGSGPARSADQYALGRRLATDPTDWQAHLDLAELRLRQSLPGEALREYLVLLRAEKLPTNAAAQVAYLLRERGRLRLALGDADALTDVEQAQELVAQTPNRRQAALELAAVAALRHSSHFISDKAPGYLARLDSSKESALLASHRRLDDKSAEELATLFAWFDAAGAKRHALRVVQAYVDAGGREPRILQRWVDLHGWWFGTSRPLVPREVATQLSPPAGPLARMRGMSFPRRFEANARALARDWGVPDRSDGLVEIEAAFRKDAALAYRLARRFVDRSVYGARERALVAELFYRLGDPQRAMRWTIELAELSQRMPVFQLSAGLGCAAAGEIERANLYFTAAAAASGDPGRYWAIAARSQRRMGWPLAAVAAGRRALSLTAPGRDLGILLEVARAQEDLGRLADAQSTRAALLGRFPPDQRAEARRLLEERSHGASEVMGSGTLLGPVRRELGFPATSAR